NRGAHRTCGGGRGWCLGIPNPSQERPAVKLADLMPKGLLKDEQDAIALLEADHDKVLALFDQFEDIKQSPAHQEKQAIVADACHALSIHMAVEEGVFYPAVRDAVEEDDLMNEALVEHDGAKSL